MKRSLAKFGIAEASWVAHVGMCISPRQILADGDLARRSCEAAEAYGAKVKHIIHNLVVRRKKAAAASSHQKEGGKMQQWQQTFTVSRVVQTFRRCCLLKRLLDAPEYAHLLSREQANVKEHGTAVKKRVRSVLSAVQDKSLQTRIAKAVDVYDVSKYDAQQ